MFDSRYFNGKSYFGDDASQNYLIFQPLTTRTGSTRFLVWTSKDSIKPPYTSENSLSKTEF